MFEINYNRDIKNLTTFGISAEVDVLAEYTDVDGLMSLLQLPELQSRKLLNIGSGSNVLFTERFKGVVLHSLINSIEIVEETDDCVCVRAGSGVIWDDFVDWSVSHGYYGVENLSAIPGTVGASAVQNIGAYGAEAKDAIVSVETIDTVTREARVFDAGECAFGYRDSVFKHTQPAGRYVITHVVYRLMKHEQFNLGYGALSSLESDPELSSAKVRNYITEVRDKKLPNPSTIGSAGSFFKNPLVSAAEFAKLAESYPDMPHYESGRAGMVKLPAGWLIETAGLKGYSIGGAQVWPRQCLVIANTGGATAGDVLALMRYVKTAVKNKFNVDLYPEVLLVGGDGLLDTGSENR